MSYIEDKRGYRMQERYSRQILFSGVGEEGQRKIRESMCLLLVLVLGANAEAIVRAGVEK